MLEVFIAVGAFTGLSVLAALVFMAIRCSYYNGVVDGYGYAKEPSCPGYEDAGEYLREVMAHRWPELSSPALEEQIHRAQMDAIKKALQPRKGEQQHG